MISPKAGTAWPNGFKSAGIITERNVSIMADIITTGELLIDFTPVKAPGFENAVCPNPGGAPGNVAVQLARLGVQAGFIGKVGDDNFGRALKSCLEDNGVDVHNVVVDENAHTTLAFVHLDREGDRSFTFYRDPGADTQLRGDEVDQSALKECKVFHFGSLSLTNEPSRTTTLDMAKKARDMGKIVSYDPNWRPALWKDAGAGIEAMGLGLTLCHVLKISEEELSLLTGTDSVAEGVRAVHEKGVKLVLVTMGPDGCVSSLKGRLSHHPTYDVKVADTTGSGDSFWGAFLSQLVQNGYDTPDKLDGLGQEELSGFCRFANAAGSVCATKPGGIPALAGREDILRCMESTEVLETGFKLM